MIRVFKATDTVFTSNGDKIIKPIDAVIAKNADEEYIELEAPLEYAEFLIQDNILITDTLTGKKGYRIHNPTVGRTIKIKALLHYQENQPAPEDRGAVISYGKNLEDCEVSETWDNVVTKLTPTGYNGAVLPEGYLSVVTPHQLAYEKTAEFELSESLKPTIETMEATIEADTAAVANLAGLIETLGSNIIACQAAIDNLAADVIAIQGKIAGLGTSEAELKEKAILEAEIISINGEITALSTDKTAYENSRTQARADHVTASASLATEQTTYNDLIVSDLRTQAQNYLDANIYPQVNYTLEAHLNGVVEVGDTVKVIHERLKIDMLAYVTAYQFDCLTSKFINVQFGTQKVALKSRITGMEQNIKTVSDGVKGASTLIKQLSDQIVLRVDANGKMALFKLASDANGTQIFIKADNIKFEGLVTANEYFKILEDGSIEAVNGTFKGKIIGSSFIGGSIESENYVPGVSGSKYYLIDGAIDTKHFKLDAEGNAEITGGSINIVAVSDEQSIITFTYNTKSMRLTPGAVTFTNDTTNTAVSMHNYGSFPIISFTENGIPVVQITNSQILMPGKQITCGPLVASSISEGGVSLPSKYAPYSHTHGNVTANFITADGKTVSVSNGIVVGVV